MSNHAAAIVIGSDSDRVLDSITKGRKGTSRPGFHLAFRAERFVSASGLPGRRNITERCACSAKANHA